MSLKYDLVIIGAGSAGVRLARFSASLGAKVALCEDSKMGGTCVNIGCVPKKLYSYASKYSHEFDNARKNGWEIQGNPIFNMSILHDKKNTEIKRLNDIYKNMLENNGVNLFLGHAKIISNSEVEVNGEILNADKIVIATGGVPVIPNIDGKEHAKTSDDVFKLEKLPDTVSIIGSGYIAVEFASILNNFGCDVTLITRGSKLLGSFDNDISAHLLNEIKAKGIKHIPNVNVTKIENIKNHYELTCDNGSKISTKFPLFAIGRKPRTDGFGNMKFNMNKHGYIDVNDKFETSQKNIYAMGDIIGTPQLTPVALYQATKFANYLFDGGLLDLNYNDIPTAVFTDPEIATVGITEEEAIKNNIAIKVYKSNFRAMKHSLAKIETKTLMKMIVCDKTDVVLGIHMIGEYAAEIIQLAGTCVKAKLTKQQFDDTIGIHPTSAEELVTLRNFERK